jgi:hypothetical protein
VNVMSEAHSRLDDLVVRPVCDGFEHREAAAGTASWLAQSRPPSSRPVFRAAGGRK